MIRRIVPFARGKQEQGFSPLGSFFFGWLAFVCAWGIFLLPTGAMAALAGQVSAQQPAPGNENEDLLRLAWKAGQQLCLEGRFTKAIAYLQQYVKERPRSADGWYWLGKAQEGAGNLEKAQEAYRKALEVDPEYPALSRILAAHEDGNALPLWDPAQHPFSAQPTLPKGQAYFIAPQAHQVEVLVPQGGVVQELVPQMSPMISSTLPQQGVVPIMPSPQGMRVLPGGVPRIEFSNPFQDFSSQQEQSEPSFAAPSPSPSKPTSTRPRVPLSAPIVVKPATPPPSGKQQQKSSSSKSAPVYVPPPPTSHSGTSTVTGTPLPQQNLSPSPAGQPSEVNASTPQAPLHLPPEPSEGAATVPLQNPLTMPPTPATPQQLPMDRFSPSETADLESAPKTLSEDVSQDKTAPPASK
jgi:hypothetical protein